MRDPRPAPPPPVPAPPLAADDAPGLPGCRAWVSAFLAVFSLCAGLWMIWTGLTARVVETTYADFVADDDRPTRVRLTQCEADLDRGWMTTPSKHRCELPLVAAGRAGQKDPAQVVFVVDDRDLERGLAALGAEKDPERAAQLERALDRWTKGPFEGFVDPFGSSDTRKDLELGRDTIFVEAKTAGERAGFGVVVLGVAAFMAWRAARGGMLGWIRAKLGPRHT